MSRTTLLALSASLVFEGVVAQSRFCNNVRNYADYNASTTHEIPALSVDGLDIKKDGDKKWELTARVSSTSPGGGTGSAVTSYYIDTKDSNTENLGLCVEGLRIFDASAQQPAWLLSRKVLERSVEDEGDCKKMLGEDCVEALRTHYATQAAKYMEKGECPTQDYDLLEFSTIEWNTTVPYQCSGLVGGREEWAKGNSSLWTDFGNITANLQEVFDRDGNCDIPPISPLPQSMHSAGTSGSAYNQSIRFPTPAFFTFWANSTEGQEPKRGVPHVEITCIIPDELNNSLEPPQANELLSNDKFKWNENATDPQDGEGEGEGQGQGEPTSTQSTGGVGVVRTAAPVLGAGAVGLLGFLLV